MYDRERNLTESLRVNYNSNQYPLSSFQSRKTICGKICWTLQEMELKGFSWQHATAQQARILWSALAALASLTSLKLHVDNNDDQTGQGKGHLLYSASKLVQIR